MGDKFYKIRRKGTTDQFSTGGEEPFWSPVGKTWNKVAHLNCHIQQVRQPPNTSGRRTYGSYQYRHSGMTPADYAEAEVVTFEAVVVEVQDAASFLQGAKSRKDARERKKAEIRRSVPRNVRHDELQTVDPESPYRRACPVCKTGVLLMSRDPQTGMLLEDDYCVGCGQRFRYLDIEELRERLR